MKKFFFLLIFISLIFFNLSYLCSENICFIISSKLKPYIDMINGFSDISKAHIEIYDFSQNKLLKNEIDHCLTFISAGNSANKFLKKYRCKNNQKKIFTFLIYKNEAKSFLKEDNTFAIYLFPPPEELIEYFKKEGFKVLLAPYSNKKVEEYLINSKFVFNRSNIRLKMLKLDSFKNFEKYLEKNKHTIFWFLPDNLYSSVDIIEYLIRQATLFHIKTVGYNRYFYNSGSTYSIIVNYRNIGKILNKIIKGEIRNNTINAPFIFKGYNKK